MFNTSSTGAGYAAIIVNVIAITYFASIMSYPLLYIYHSMSTPLPWQSCGNPWNTDKCTEVCNIILLLYILVIECILNIHAGMFFSSMGIPVSSLVMDL